MCVCVGGGGVAYIRTRVMYEAQRRSYGLCLLFFFRSVNIRNTKFTVKHLGRFSANLKLICFSHPATFTYEQDFFFLIFLKGLVGVGMGWEGLFVCLFVGGVLDG